MKKESAAGRAIKQKVLGLLKSSDFDNALFELCQMPGRQVINPLFSFLHNSNQDVKWAAVRAMGAVVSNLADDDMESARVIMRRLMWNLNDESGGIGWGSPEAMGEILANHEDLGREYVHVLISYTRENGNYLEHELLQRGLLWAIGRLAQAKPELLQNAIPYLLPYLESLDATVRGLASWLMGLLGVGEATSRLQGLTHDRNQLQIYLDNQLTGCRVMDLAEEALNAIKEKRKKFDSAPSGKP